MVQNSGALREPSMDEILTSIREIIEENAVKIDCFSEGGVAMDDLGDHAEVPAGGVCETNLSVDDAMKALADRIGLPSGSRNFSPVQADSEEKSLMQAKGGAEVEHNAVNTDAQKAVLSSAEQDFIRAANRCDKTFTTQQKNAEVDCEGLSASDCAELSAYCVSSAEKIARDVLRPAVAKWLQSQLPVLLEKVLCEEIVKAIKKLP